MGNFVFLRSLPGDLRFGLRQLRLNPTFTAVAVLSLALGIGANTAIFQLIDAVRLRPLPVSEPQQLGYIDFAKGSSRSGNWSSRSARLTASVWENIRDRQQGFSGVFVWSATQFNLAQGGKARYAQGLFVSAGFFDILRVPAVLGRTFTAADDRPGCGAPGAVLSHAYWESSLGGDPQVLGKYVTLDGHSFPVIGVAQAGFFGVDVGNRFDIAVPLCADPLFFDDGKGRIPNKRAWWLSMMGRLKPGWTLERANAQIRNISPAVMEASLASDYRPEQAKKYLENKLTVETGATGVSQLRRDYENPLWILLGTTGLVLLIACANLANLLLARASVREREVAIRQAIGASRGRLISQLLSESMLLAAGGAALGGVFASMLSQGLLSFLTTDRNAMFVSLGIDWRVLGFTAAIAVMTCLLFGLAPALRATKVAPASVMRASGRGLTTGRERFSLRRFLVVAQVSLSLVLLAGALLFVRSLQKLLDVNAGFNPEGVVAMSVDLRPGKYPKERITGVRRELLEKLAGRQGVSSAAEVMMTPVSGSGWNEDAWADGTTMAHKDTLFNSVGAGYFRTMGTRMIGGRDFDDHDDLKGPKVAIVNQQFAKEFFGGRSPVGERFRVEDAPGKPDRIYQIVGLVSNTKYYEMREDDRVIAFLPATQERSPDPGVNFVIRTNGPVGELFRNATAAMAEVNPAFSVNFTVLSTQLKESLMRDRLMAALAGAFGVLAGGLAVLGLYGVIAYMVARRRNEIGVRIALGASRGGVIRLVLREAAVLLTAGLVVGTGLSLWAGRAAASLLYGVKPTDPAALGGAVALLAVVALAASYTPAWKASRLQPMDALRDE